MIIIMKIISFISVCVWACIIELSHAFIDGHMLDFLQKLIKTSVVHI